jgi:hypothetical protein
VLLVVLVPFVGETVVVVVLVELEEVVFELVGTLVVVAQPEMATAIAATEITDLNIVGWKFETY